MHNATTSRHIRSATELIIFVPIKNEFVPISEFVMTYASRVSAVLKALAEVRQQKLDRGFGDPVGPIELLETIHRVQWTVLEPFDDVGARAESVTRQLRTPQIMLTSHFDGSWEEYFYQLVDVGGPLLDLIFSHCEGYEGQSCSDGYEGFAKFIRRHQRPCDFLYATAPDVTVSDLRYYTRLPSRLASGPAEVQRSSIATVKVEATQFSPIERSLDERTRATLRTVHALHDLGQRLFSAVPGLKTTRDGDITDKDLYERAIKSVLEYEPDVKRLAAALKAEPLRGRESLGEAVEWVSGVLAPQPAAPAVKAVADPQPDDLFNDVQANILSAHGRTGTGRLLLLQCTDAAGFRQLLSSVAPKLTTEAMIRRGALPDTCLQLGITYRGFKLLGLTEGMLEQFPREFREGMEERAGILGDVAHNHPKLWRLPLRRDGAERVHLSAVHVAITVVGVPEDVESIVAEWRKPNDQWELVHELALDASSAPERSQPVPPAAFRAQGPRPSKLDDLPLTAFLLGYDATARSGSQRLFKNGTFLAMRKMQQDNQAFDAYVDQVAQQIAVVSGAEASTLPASLKDEVKALIIGQKPDGGLLGSLQQPRANPNAFDYAGDPSGELCPYHSHARRTNPRNEGTPRIVRRGLAYLPEPNGPEQGESGLLFMAYCASLAKQYELVQRYVNGANSTGILSRQNDLLCGTPLHDTGPRFVSLAATSASQLGPGPTVIQLPERTKPFVTLRWGLYLFVPSLDGLRWLVDTRETDATTALAESIARGQARIAELEALPPDLRVHEWKRILEEVPEAGSVQALHAKDVAAAITAKHAGALRVSVGPAQAGELSDFVVVTTEVLARKVLSIDEDFSVSEYRTRLKESLDDHYLGYDVSTRDEVTKRTYREQSSEVNRELETLEDRAFCDALTEARKVLTYPYELDLDPDGKSPDGSTRSTISIRDLAYAVVAQLCHVWLNLPGLDNKSDRMSLMKSLERFLVASRYCFQAMPVTYLRDQARNNRWSILSDYDGERLNGPIAERLPPPSIRAHATPEDQRHFRRMALLGAVGFAPPAVGAITRMIDQWIETEELWQLQKRVKGVGQDGQAVILPAIYAALADTPAPPTLYRTATKDTELGRARVPKGARVIVNLAAVYADARDHGKAQPEAWFFGGVHGGADRTDGNPPHGCPARNAGNLVMAGVVAALLEQKNLRRERRLVLSYDNPQAHACRSDARQ